MKAQTMKKLITYLFAQFVTGLSPSIAMQEIKIPNEMKRVGSKIETMAPKDLNVVVNFL